MPIAWSVYRALCCVTPGLEPESRAFDAANARFAERVTMPEGILLALVSPRADFDPQANRRGLESNIRFCDFFVQIFGEVSSDPAFRELADLAVSCKADPAFPLRSTVVVFRNPETAAPEIAAFRNKMSADSRCIVHDFHDSSEFDALADIILAEWHTKVQERLAAPAAAR